MITRHNGTLSVAIVISLSAHVLLSVWMVDWVALESSTHKQSQSHAIELAFTPAISVPQPEMTSPNEPKQVAQLGDKRAHQSKTESEHGVSRKESGVGQPNDPGATDVAKPMVGDATQHLSARIRNSRNLDRMPRVLRKKHARTRDNMYGSKRRNSTQLVQRQSAEITQRGRDTIGDRRREIRADEATAAATAADKHSTRRAAATTPSPQTALTRNLAWDSGDDRERPDLSQREKQDILDAAAARRAAWEGGAQQRGGLGRVGDSQGQDKGQAVWLNTVDPRYIAYFRKVYQRVQPLWRFPKGLERLMEQGDVIVRFTISADGDLLLSEIVRSSGYERFDENVLDAIREAAPFDPIPPDLGERLVVLAPFEFANPMVR